MRLFLRIAVWVFASVPLAGSLAAQPSMRSVLVIDEADPVRPAYFPRNFAFRSTLNKGMATRVAIYAENLDLSRFDSPQVEPIVGTYFREKYREKSIDLIVVNGSRALELVLRLRATMWSGVPVVFSSIEEATAARLKLPSDVTGIVVRRTLADALTTARALVPQLKRIAVVGDPPELQPFQRPYIKEFPAFATELELIDLTGLPIERFNRASECPATGYGNHIRGDMEWRYRSGQHPRGRARDHRRGGQSADCGRHRNLVRIWRCRRLPCAACSEMASWLPKLQCAFSRARASQTFPSPSATLIDWCLIGGS